MVPSTSWRKSTHSDQSDCVEVAFAGDGAAVRDSKNVAGPTLTLTAFAFRQFVAGVSETVGGRS